MFRVFNRKKARKGFSLLEMSVVMTSVAAVMVVTAGSVSLVNKARINDVISDISSFTKAVDQFERRFDAIPGDIADVSAIPGASASNAGNGNGIVDPNEALMFWRHLSLTKILKMKFDGSSGNIPGKGIPQGEIKQSGYKIYDPSNDSTIPDQALVIQLSGFSASVNSSDLPILKADDAKSIDLKMDNGDPNTGSVRAVGTDCIKDGSYNTSNKSVSCRMLFIIRSHVGTSEESISAGTCTEIGSTRETPDIAKTCPAGTTGKIMETCQLDGTSAIWKIAHKNCSPVVCAGGKPFGTTRNLGCVNGQKGSGIVQTCTEGGVWTNDVSNSNCSTLSANSDSACTIVGKARDPQACGWGEEGVHFQICNASLQWETSASLGGNTCAPIKCGADNIGKVRTSATSCGSNHLGTVYETCTMDGTYKVTHNNCKPQYSGGCTADTTRDVGCPAGENGEHIQLCVSGSPNYWTTKTDSCKPVTCDGMPIGTARPAKGGACSNLSSGIVVEVCGADGNWVTSEKNCTPAMCYSSQAGSGSTAGYATWPNALANSASVSGTCDVGYEGTATRACGSDNTWATPSAVCTRIQCPAVANENLMSWPQSDATVNNIYGEPIPSIISGTCLEGMEDTGGSSPTRQCKSDGTWHGTINNTCTPVLVVTPWGVSSGLRLWLDAIDPSGTVPNDGDPLTTWYDKSGYANNASAGGASPPTYVYNSTNGHASVHFDGGGYFSLNGGSYQSNKETSFYAVRRTNEAKTNYLYDGASGGGGYRFELPTWGVHISKSTSSSGISGCGDGGYALGTQVNVITLVLEQGTDHKIYVNGGLESSGCGNYWGQSSDSVTLGAISWSMSTAFEGYWGEVIMYRRILSDTERGTVRAYLDGRWKP